MKNIPILLLLFLIRSIALGQNREILKQNKFNSATFKTHEIEVKKKWFDSVKINFQGDVEFIDKRADESKLGFVRMGEDNSYYNFVFPEKSIKYLNSRFQHIIKPVNNGAKLQIVIRHLWMSQLITKATFGQAILTGPKGYISYCYFKADYYREKDGMVQFAGEFDTVISLRKWMGNADDDLMKKALVTALTACNDMLASSSSNPFYPTGQLSDSLENQFNYPILKTSEPKKGIYRNYEDFLNNNPVEGDFEVKTEKPVTWLLSNTIDTAVTNAAWGYSDGKDIYKHLNESYYKMNRVQNTFELAGPRVIRSLFTKEQIFFKTAVSHFLGGISSGGITLLFLLNDEKIMRELVPYQLNIKEGTFY
jgi:hypothetical protein